MNAEWKIVSGVSCLYFKFGVHLTEGDAMQAIVAWKRAFASRPDKKICVIWDCLEMKNYDQGARRLWQKAIDELKGQIDSIWLLTTSTLIIIGAHAISTFTSLKINTVQRLEDIKFKPKV